MKLETEEQANEYYAFKVKDDSMEPRIMEKDILIIQNTRYFESGDIILLSIKNYGITCKKAFKTEQGFFLHPLNSKYKSEYFDNAEFRKNVIVLGKVVELRSIFE